jgi:hypothetical protein
MKPPPTKPAPAGKGHETPAPPLPRTRPHEPDPEGVAPADKAAEDEPKARPNADRHRMETAIARHPPRRR